MTNINYVKLNKNLKIRLFFLGFLSLMVLIGFLLMWTHKAHYTYIIDVFTGEKRIISRYYNDTWITRVALISCNGFLSIILSIITLSINKANKGKGLVIAMGVVGILTGLFGVNVILAIISVFIAKVSQPKIDERIEKLKNEIEVLKANSN